MRILVENAAGRRTFRTWGEYRDWVPTAGHHTVRVLTLIEGELP